MGYVTVDVIEEVEVLDVAYVEVEVVTEVAEEVDVDVCDVEELVDFDTVVPLEVDWEEEVDEEVVVVDLAPFQRTVPSSIGVMLPPTTIASFGTEGSCRFPSTPQQEYVLPVHP